MKKWIFYFLLCVLVITNGYLFAQTSVNTGTRKTKNVSLSEYVLLKSQRLISNEYNYVIDNGINHRVSFSNRNSLIAPSLTPCDVWPTQGNVGYTTQVDDSPLLTVPIPFNFCFYGVNYTSLNLSANGNVQFSTNDPSYSATGFPSNAVNMIAPFWADGQSMVTQGGRTYGKIYIDPHPTYMIITWDSLGYFNDNVDKLNSFQLVLTNGLDPILPPNKNVGFFYKKMEWTTGDVGGTNGFPTTQPGTPATVGINQGNGIDFFLIGRFGVPGTVYDGPAGNSDGVSWLDGKKFFFNVCPPVGGNIEPASTLMGICDTVRVCGNDTLVFKNGFIGPELTQTVSITANAPSLGASFTFNTVQSGNNSDINMTIYGSTASAGYHVVTLTATDNGTPAQSTVQSFVVFIDPASANNLTGNVILTPTIGACPGGAVSANVLVGGGIPSSYLWSNSASGSSTSYTIQPSLDSLVYVTVKSGYCKKTFSKYIRVNPVPVATITGNTSLCAITNSTAILTASNSLNFSAQAPYTYQWVGNQTQPSPVSSQTTSATGGTYSVTIINRFNCRSTAVITLSVSPTPVFTVVPSSSPIICLGSAITLSLSLANTPPTSCGISNSGACLSPNSITVGSGNVSNTSTTHPSVYGNYFKNVRHQLIYTAAELLSAGVVAGKISSISFMVNSIPASYIGTIPGLTIKLKCTQQNSFSSSSDFDNVGLIQVYTTPNYSPIVGWNQHNFSSTYEWDGSSNILVDVCYNLNNGSQFTSNPIMASSTLAGARCMYDGSDNLPMCGSFGNTPNTTVRRLNAKFGNCTASNPSLFSYTWTPTNNLNPVNSHTAIANPTITTVYNIEAEYPGNTTCRHAQTVTVNVISPITPTITPVEPLCSNATPFSFTATPTGGTWAGSNISSNGVLSPSLITQGIQTYTYTLGAGICPITGTTSVDITKFIAATITGTAGPYCIYTTSNNIQSIAQYTGGVWSGTAITGAVFTPSIAGAGTHIITYSTNSGGMGLCPDQHTVAIIVNAKPEANALTDKTNGCSPVTFNFSTNTVNTGNASWNFGDGSPLGIGLNTSHTYNIPGTYTAVITYTDAVGCVDTTKILTAVTVYSVPISSFNPSVIETTVVDGQIDFTNKSTNLNGNSYLWDIGGFITASSQNTSYLFTTTGNHLITLTATNPNGCVNDTTIIVKINPDVVLYVPNAFTPGNGDVLNDDFKIFLPPTGVDFSTFKLLIFDRWGELIYETNDVNASWNGSRRNTGVLLKQDTYVWKISFRDDKRIYYEKVGHVSLLGK